jgi:hypothetical protein
MDIMTSTVVTGLVGFVSTLIGYKYGTKKQNAETDSLVLQNVKGILEIQQNTIKGLTEEINKLKLKVDEYEQMVGSMSKELHQLRKELKQYSQT